MSTWVGGQAFGASRSTGVLALVLWSCVPLFCPLSRFALGALLANVALFRVFRGFLAWFVGFVWVCLVLVLCVACGALYACGVRRFKGLWRVCLRFSCFVLFFDYVHSLFVLCVLLCSGCLSLSSCIVFVALWVWLLFPFPLRTTRKKRGRKGFSLRPLFVCCECSNSCNVIKELRCRCFGFFQFVRLILPTNTGRIRRLACFHFDFLRHNIDITYNPSAFLK